MNRTRFAFVAAAVVAGTIGLALPGASAQSKPPAKAGKAAKPSVPQLVEQVTELRAEVDTLKQLAVAVPTVSDALSKLDVRLGVIEQDLQLLKREQHAIPDAITAIDELEGRLRELEQDIRGLRTSVAELERAGVAGGGSSAGVTRGSGFTLTTADRAYSLTVAGYGQIRYEFGAPGGLDEVDESTLRVRRARVGFSGRLGGDDLTYKLLFDTVKSPSAHDFYLDYAVVKGLSVRAGQYKTQFIRSFMTSSSRLIFPERSQVVEGLRYDRDVQVGAHGQLFNGKFGYYAGIANGAGRVKTNDNVDLNPVLRIEYAPLGKLFKMAAGDVKGSDDLQVVVGAGFVHDLVPLPEELAGVALNRDVDGDGDTDNVRVISVGADIAVRYKGFGAEFDWIFRRESYGEILTANPGLEAVLDRIGGATNVRNYQGIVVQASYMVLPQRLLVGGRFGQARQSVLGVAGRHAEAEPAGPRLREVDAVIQLFDKRFGGRALGLQYTFFDYTSGGPNSHRLILETQVKF